MTARAASLVVGAALAAAAFGVDPPDEPRDVGLVERASTRLAQLDVTVAGPKDAIEGLTAADFEVRLNDRLVPNVLVDDLCLAQPGARAAAPQEAPAPVLPSAEPP